MSKLALINRNEKRKKLVKKFAKKRIALALVLLHEKLALQLAIDE